MATIESVSVCIARVPLDNAVTFSIFSTEAVAKYGTVYPGSKEAWQVVRAEAR